MADVQTDVSPAALVAAIEASLFAFFPLLGGWGRAEAHDEPDMLWTLSDVPFPLFNSVVRARLSGGGVDPGIDWAVARCAGRDVPLLWWTGPQTRPAGLESRLAARGFIIEHSKGMAADLGGLAPSAAAIDGWSVEPVRDQAGLETWASVLCSGFGATEEFGRAFGEMATAIGLHTGSPFQHFLGWLDGTPVATCSLLLAAGVAGLYDVSTVPERRRRGLGAAIARAALDEALVRGYRVAVLHASALGAGMYRSLGFRDYCRIGQCVWVPPGGPS